jgi:hypothetical protein
MHRAPNRRRLPGLRPPDYLDAIGVLVIGPSYV